MDRIQSYAVNGIMPILQRWWGTAFSITMSGVFSRMIRDPTGEKYHTILNLMGSVLFLSGIIILLLSIMLIYHYGDRIGLWIPQSYHYYLLLASCVGTLYFAGYIAIDNLSTGLVLILLAGGFLTLLVLKKESWGIYEPRIIRRITNPR
ncbi:MAG: hypothetical protein PWQ88_173 [Candidatus Methanomethylophilaceae archaeon]|nr:hypothetical protein [Candidatus Methanomethylophilaceae archaeon]MDI3541688.1 hypothetical protein [Candidatus Methanomethylophilaceae archaeon]HIJ00380.1 hypothetical protein [Candidatus Methanomethylophilaceae archaeon]